MSPNILVPNAILIIINVVSFSDIFGVSANLTVSKISSASFLALLVISLLSFLSFSCMRISNFLKNFSKVKFVLSVASVSR